VAQLAELSALGEFEATKATYTLMKTGHVQPAGHSEPVLKAFPAGDASDQGGQGGQGGGW
jgi:hypothetical protein